MYRFRKVVNQSHWRVDLPSDFHSYLIREHYYQFSQSVDHFLTYIINTG